MKRSLARLVTKAYSLIGLMIKDSSRLLKGQKLRVDLEKVRDNLPQNIRNQITTDPCGRLVGYKMVDGNQFGLALDFGNGNVAWFFEDELSELVD